MLYFNITICHTTFFRPVFGAMHLTKRQTDRKRGGGAREGREREKREREERGEKGE